MLSFSGFDRATVLVDGFGGLVLLVPCRFGEPAGTTQPARVLRFNAQQGLHDERLLDTCAPSAVETRDGVAIMGGTFRSILTASGWRPLPALPLGPNAGLPSARFVPMRGTSLSPTHLEAYSAGPEGELMATRVWSDPWVTSTVDIQALQGNTWRQARRLTLLPRNTGPRVPPSGSYFSLAAAVGTRDFVAQTDMYSEEPGGPFLGSNTFIEEDSTNPGTWVADRTGSIGCGRFNRGSLDCVYFVLPNGEVRYYTTNPTSSILFCSASVWALRVPAGGGAKQWVGLVNPRGTCEESPVSPQSASSREGDAFAYGRAGGLLEGGQAVQSLDASGQATPLVSNRVFVMDQRGDVALAWLGNTSTGVGNWVYAMRRGVRTYTEPQRIHADVAAADQPTRLEKNGVNWTLVILKRRTLASGAVEPAGIQVFTGTPTP